MERCSWNSSPVFSIEEPDRRDQSFNCEKAADTECPVRKPGYCIESGGYLARTKTRDRIPACPVAETFSDDVLPSTMTSRSRVQEWALKHVGSTIILGGLESGEDQDNEQEWNLSPPSCTAVREHFSNKSLSQEQAIRRHQAHSNHKDPAQELEHHLASLPQPRRSPEVSFRQCQSQRHAFVSSHTGDFGHPSIKSPRSGEAGHHLPPHVYYNSSPNSRDFSVSEPGPNPKNHARKTVQDYDEDGTISLPKLSDATVTQEIDPAQLFVRKSTDYPVVMVPPKTSKACALHPDLLKASALKQPVQGSSYYCSAPIQPLSPRDRWIENNFGFPGDDSMVPVVREHDQCAAQDPYARYPEQSFGDYKLKSYDSLDLARRSEPRRHSDKLHAPDYFKRISANSMIPASPRRSLEEDRGPRSTHSLHAEHTTASELWVSNSNVPDTELHYYDIVNAQARKSLEVAKLERSKTERRTHDSKRLSYSGALGVKEKDEFLGNTIDDGLLATGIRLSMQQSKQNRRRSGSTAGEPNARSPQKPVQPKPNDHVETVRMDQMESSKRYASDSGILGPRSPPDSSPVPRKTANGISQDSRSRIPTKNPGQESQSRIATGVNSPELHTRISTTGKSPELHTRISTTGKSPELHTRIASKVNSPELHTRIAASVKTLQRAPGRTLSQEPRYRVSTIVNGQVQQPGGKVDGMRSTKTSSSSKKAVYDLVSVGIVIVTILLLLLAVQLH